MNNNGAQTGSLGKAAPASISCSLGIDIRRLVYKYSQNTAKKLNKFKKCSLYPKIYYYLTWRRRSSEKVTLKGCAIKGKQTSRAGVSNPRVLNCWPIITESTVDRSATPDPPPTHQKILTG